MAQDHIEILLVEDNPADAELTKQGLLQAPIESNLHVVEHGGKAISFLRREGQFSDAPRPDLILLDMVMPQLDGRDVLRVIKNDDALCDIPVVILSSLDGAEDIREAYQLHANAYMNKPVKSDEFVQLLQSVNTYWFAAVNLPHHDAIAD